MVPHMQLAIVDLKPDDPRLITDVMPVLQQLRPHLDGASLAAIYREGYKQGLRFTAACAPDGACLGVAGWRIVATTHSIRKLYVDDLVTAQTARSRGVGHALLAELESRARASGCKVLDLDSGIQRHDAHRFYMREQLSITSHHFAKDL
jgi:GNAT superfamily N-acetyltransferase